MTAFHRCVLTIPTVDDLLLAVTRLGSPSAPATVVYVHGLLCDGNYWAPVTECLHDRLGGEITQIVYDQRGHGRSGRPDRRAATTLRHLVDDLDTVLAHATGEIVLVTHSASSLLAAAYAQHHPTHAAALSALVLFGGAGEFPEFPSLPQHYRQLIKRVPQLRRTRLDGVAAATAAVAERQFRSASRRWGSKAHLMCGAHSGDSRVLADVMGAYSTFALSPESTAILRRIPTFVIAGERDRVVPSTQSVRLADQIWADYELVPGAGHFLPHVQPDRAAEVILQALEVAYRREIDRLISSTEETTVDGREDSP
ncbi:alpha/beta fold hydrolase [Nocardia sp. SYP-A9097]|uniref:alpha/beta fold hydrolase n=1 Tax=Nocardia sp. SYP-A9097 TaxID=2663237 RepID=UPI00129BF325|nr:alpha/beta hydrolase [Nocardia sp. SYP-A9097]MRH92956.1 alpha/beta fold hydrolase [Nocardia sp. SYP-A9097]